MVLNYIIAFSFLRANINFIRDMFMATPLPTVTNHSDTPIQGSSSPIDPNTKPSVYNTNRAFQGQIHSLKRTLREADPSTYTFDPVNHTIIKTSIRYDRDSQRTVVIDTYQVTDMMKFNPERNASIHLAAGLVKEQWEMVGKHIIDVFKPLLEANSKIKRAEVVIIPPPSESSSDPVKYFSRYSETDTFELDQPLVAQEYSVAPQLPTILQSREFQSKFKPDISGFHTAAFTGYPKGSSNKQFYAVSDLFLRKFADYKKKLSNKYEALSPSYKHLFTMEPDERDQSLGDLQHERNRRHTQSVELQKQSEKTLTPALVMLQKKQVSLTEQSSVLLKDLETINKGNAANTTDQQEAKKRDLDTAYKELESNAVQIADKKQEIDVAMAEVKKLFGEINDIDDKIGLIAMFNELSQPIEMIEQNIAKIEEQYEQYRIALEELADQGSNDRHDSLESTALESGGLYLTKQQLTDDLPGLKELSEGLKRRKALLEMAERFKLREHFVGEGFQPELPKTIADEWHACLEAQGFLKNTDSGGFEDDKMRCKALGFESHKYDFLASLGVLDAGSDGSFIST